MKFHYLIRMTKNMYLKIDIVGHNNFINLLVNNIKVIWSNTDNLY